MGFDRDAHAAKPQKTGGRTANDQSGRDLAGETTGKHTRRPKQVGDVAVGRDCHGEIDRHQSDDRLIGPLTGRIGYGAGDGPDHGDGSGEQDRNDRQRQQRLQAVSAMIIARIVQRSRRLGIVVLRFQFRQLKDPAIVPHGQSGIIRRIAIADEEGGDGMTPAAQVGDEFSG